MYEQVNQPKPKSNRALWIIITAVTLVFIAVILIVLWPFEYMDNFQSFVSHLSNSTVASHNSTTGLWATTQEGEVRIIGDNPHLIYFVLANAGVGKVCQVPLTPPDAVLRYADGAIMELWNLENTDSTSTRSHILCVSYQNPEGERYTYNTDHLDLSRLPLSRQANLTEKMKEFLNEQDKETAPVD